MAAETSTLEAARSLLQRCARISTATWSDALDELGIEGVVSGLPRRSGEGRCAGFAMTAHAEVGPLNGFELKDFGQDRMIAAAGPTEVLVVDAGGAEVSAMGGIVALSAHKKGIEAVVIDGACRDIDDIRKAGLWVASRHVTPRTGKRRVRLGAFGEPIVLAGVPVRRGDLVVGDATGLVVVPRERLDAVLAIAERVNSSDARLESAVAQGESLSDAARRL
jgi:regulator of RNase E activity RraA